jgi:hypothetical protein
MASTVAGIQKIQTDTTKPQDHSVIDPAHNAFIASSRAA